LHAAQYLATQFCERGWMANIIKIERAQIGIQNVGNPRLQMYDLAHLIARHIQLCGKKQMSVRAGISDAYFERI
jgi:hypothetical protein